MAKPRLRDGQQELALEETHGGTRRGGKRRGAGRKPVEKTHGGKRRGAGRKPKGMRAGSPHKKRPVLKSYHPVHVVMRVHADVGSLRKRLMYKALRYASITAAQREQVEHEKGRFRIVHISIQRTHVHMLVEAQHSEALSLGMQSFQISAAKHLNAAVSIQRSKRRRGTVFTDRFHQEIIKTPTQARRALAYVLNNWRKHREDQSPLMHSWNVDAFSTGPLFTGWEERQGEPLLWRWRETYEPLIVYLPSTWLLQKGWRERGGGAIPFRYVPSQPNGGVAAAARVDIRAE